MTRGFWALTGVCLLLFSSVVSASAFTPGNLVVSRIGDGVNNYTSGVAAPAYVDEYTALGVPVGNSIALPQTPSGGNYTLTLSQTATSIGHLTRSTDGRYLTVFGFDAPVGTSSPSSTASYRGRTVGRIDQYGAVDSTTRFEAAGSSPRSAITTTGSDIWISSDTGSGTTGGLRYVTLGSTTSGTLLTDGNFTTNDRVVGIFNNQLYVSAGSSTVAGSWRGVNKIGTGLPTTGGQAGTVVVGGGVADAGPCDSTYDFFFADANTLYVADDDNAGVTITGGLQKWTFNGSAWSKIWTIIPSGSIGLRSLAGATDISGNVILYGISAESSGTAANKLVSVSDTLGGTLPPAFTTLATASANTVFRGVDFAPIPEPATLVLLAGAALMMVRRRAM